MRKVSVTCDMQIKLDINFKVSCDIKIKITQVTHVWLRLTILLFYYRSTSNILHC